MVMHKTIAITVTLTLVLSSICMGQKKLDPLGVQGSGNARKDKLNEGWTVVMPGEESRRSKELHRVAITRAEIKFDSNENFKKFLEVIKASDERLRRVPDANVMYDWQMITRKGNTVRFGVAWYDKDFFLERKDAYKSDMHRGILSEFGVTPESIRIEHVPLEKIE